MNPSYKALQYKVCIHHDAVFDKNEPWNNCPAYDTTEFRYRIVSSETGEVLDDAQGYGYKTAQKAYAAYAFKNRDRSKDKEKQEKKKHIIKWVKDHKSFINLLNFIPLIFALQDDFINNSIFSFIILFIIISSVILFLYNDCLNFVINFVVDDDFKYSFINILSCKFSYISLLNSFFILSFI